MLGFWKIFLLHIATLPVDNIIEVASIMNHSEAWVRSLLICLWPSVRIDTPTIDTLVTGMDNVPVSQTQNKSNVAG